MFGLIIWLVFILIICFCVCGGWFYVAAWIVGGTLSLFFGVKYELK